MEQGDKEHQWWWCIQHGLILVLSISKCKTHIKYERQFNFDIDCYWFETHTTGIIREFVVQLWQVRLDDNFGSMVVSKFKEAILGYDNSFSLLVFIFKDENVFSLLKNPYNLRFIIFEMAWPASKLFSQILYRNTPVLPWIHLWIIYI